MLHSAKIQHEYIVRFWDLNVKRDGVRFLPSFLVYLFICGEHVGIIEYKIMEIFV